MDNRTYNIEINSRILELLGPNLYTYIYCIGRAYSKLQTFLISCRFFEDEESVSLTKAARYIGNAVSPKFGEVIAESINRHLWGR